MLHPFSLLDSVADSVSRKKRVMPIYALIRNMIQCEVISDFCCCILQH